MSPGWIGPNCVIVISTHCGSSSKQLFYRTSAIQEYIFHVALGPCGGFFKSPSWIEVQTL